MRRRRKRTKVWMVLFVLVLAVVVGLLLGQIPTGDGPPEPTPPSSLEQ